MVGEGVSIHKKKRKQHDVSQIICVANGNFFAGDAVFFFLFLSLNHLFF